MLRQLSEQDASFLYVETGETPAHVGGLSLVDLPAGDGVDFYEAYKRHVASRLRHVSLLHHKLRSVPLELDRPFWVEDEHVDIDYHVRHLTAPRPGRLADLEALVGLLHAMPLDRTRPLWEFYVIDGLASGQAAIYTKVHHAAMDGASSRALVEVMYDPTPEPRVLAPPPAADGGSRDTFANLARGLLARVVRQQLHAVRYVPELLLAWADLFLPDPKTLRLVPIAGLPRTPRTLLNVGITNQRVYAARTLPLGAVKQLAKQHDCKVNDVVLAVCGGALRRFLGAKGALPDAPLTAMVPISLHDASDDGAVNRNGMFTASLATDVADPRARLAAVHRSSAEQRRRFERLKLLPLPDVTLPGAALIGPRLVELYGRGKNAQRLPPFGNLVISNVPGPPVPLYVAGARIASMFPCSIPFHGSALNITVQSYCDRLDFGLIACRRALPDLAALADALGESFAELAPGGLDHAGEAQAAPRRYPRAPREPAQGPRSVAVGQ